MQQQQQQKRVEEIEIVELPRTPPGLVEPPVVSPRQSTPRTPVAQPQVFSYSPSVAITSNRVSEVEQQQQEDRTDRIDRVDRVEVVEGMEQDHVIHQSPSVISKDSEIDRISLFEFPMIPIECKFHFQVFNLLAKVDNIREHREFLDKKVSQQEKELEKIMKGFSIDLQRIVVQYIKNSIDSLIDSVKISNKKRLDNLVLDQMREKALRTIRSKNDKVSLEIVNKAQDRFERTLQLRFQLDKLDRRFNENMPPPALNIMDKLQFRSKELDKEVIEQYSEQWNSIIRKTKLDLTSIMRVAKKTEIDKGEREHLELVEKIPEDIRKAYSELVHTVKIRNDRIVQKKMNFLEKRAIRIIGE